MNLGTSIRQLRKGLTPKISQSDYAISIGITQSYLSHIENGNKEPSIALLKVISEKHDLPMPVLLFMSIDEEDVQPHKLQAFKMIKPSVDALINQVFIDKTY